jgi:hypothetical protein
MPHDYRADDLKEVNFNATLVHNNFFFGWKNLPLVPIFWIVFDMVLYFKIFYFRF